jgi:hypothetical protein
MLNSFFLNLHFALMASHFLLLAQKKVTKEKGSSAAYDGVIFMRDCLIKLFKQHSEAEVWNQSPSSSPSRLELVGSIRHGRRIEARRARMRVGPTRQQLQAARAPDRVNWLGRIFWVTFFGRTKKVTRSIKERNQCRKPHKAKIKNKQVVQADY